jgi:hypothetical protein
MKMKRKMVSYFSYFQVMEQRWNEIEGGKPKYSGVGVPVPVPLCPPQNSTWTDLGLNPGQHLLEFTTLVDPDKIYSKSLHSLYHMQVTPTCFGLYIYIYIYIAIFREYTQSFGLVKNV